MADIFTVTAPLSVRKPDGNLSVVSAIFPHQDGIIYFDLFWDIIEREKGLEYATHVVNGELYGDGPWKIGGYIFNVLGCQGTDPELATQFSQWQLHFEQQGYTTSSKEMLAEQARLLGAIVR